MTPLQIKVTPHQLGLREGHAALMGKSPKLWSLSISTLTEPSDQRNAWYRQEYR